MICLELPETGWTPEDGEKSELAKRITEILTDRGPMLMDYFSMEIDEEGNLCSIPILLGRLCVMYATFYTRVYVGLQNNTNVKQCKVR